MKRKNPEGVYIRLDDDSYSDIAVISGSQNMSIPHYIRGLIKSDIKKKNEKEYDKEEDATYHIALAVATVLQIANNQSEEARVIITETAEPILRKLKELIGQ